MDGSRQEMLRYLLGADARAAARAELRRRGLDQLDADDLINDVVVRILGADPAEPVTNPVAYARRALTHRAIDLLRGERVRRAHDGPAAARGDTEATTDPLDDAVDPAGDSPAVEAAARAGEDAMRRGVHLRLAAARIRVWTAAAALATLTLRVHPEVALPDEVPEPDAGAAKGDRWAALWLAGETGVFADPAAGRPDVPALRKARSRKLQEVERVLQEVAATVLGDDRDG